MYMIKKIKGFTLLELLLAISIIAITLILAVPSYQQFIMRMQQNLSSFQLLKAIETARQEAIVRGEIVKLCKSKDMQTCGGDWNDGYIILAGDKRLYAFQKTMGRAEGSIVWRARLGQEELEFLPTGLTRAENGAFLYCEQNAKFPSWLIVLNKSGKARIDSSDGGKRIMC